jgi:hypothetical protein
MLTNLKALHRRVAEELALGVSIAQICEDRGLNLSYWKQIVSSPLMKDEVDRISTEVSDKFTDKVAEDKVYQIFKQNEEKAAEVLTREVSNYNENAESRDRQVSINASESLLDRLGYGRKPTPQESTTIFVQVSKSKLDSLASEPEPIDIQPESIIVN